MAGGEVTRDRRRRQTFWIDDAIIDRFGPVLRRFPYGADAIAVYAVLARRADRDGESWPGLPSIALQAATSERTAQRALHLLELLGLVEITACYEAGSNRQMSNLYTLLTPPDIVPVLDPDPSTWPTPERQKLLIAGGNRSQTVTDARAGGGVEASTPRQPGTPSPASLTPPRCQVDTLPGVSLTPEGLHRKKDSTVKDGSCTGATTAERWIVEEVGLSNAQVWAAVLAELERRGEVARTDLDVWLRPASLVGRDGTALVIGVSSAVAQDRVERRLLPEIRAAVAHVVGVSLPVKVVVRDWYEVSEVAS
jgi:hypothetical protein